MAILPVLSFNSWTRGVHKEVYKEVCKLNRLLPVCEPVYDAKVQEATMVAISAGSSLLKECNVATGWRVLVCWQATWPPAVGAV